MAANICASWLIAFFSVLGAEGLRDLDEPSIFVTPQMPIPGASMDPDLAERTIVKFIRPMNINLCSIDPTDPYRPIPLFYKRRIRWYEPPPQWKSPFTGNERKFSRFDGSSDPYPIEAPGQYSFLQRRIHRLRLSEFQNDPDHFNVCATMEVMAGDSRSNEFLSRNAVPVEFTDDDLKNVREFATVMKIYYLPDPLQSGNDESGSGVQVATHPGWAIDGVDPINEAWQRGSVLLVIRMGVGQIFSTSLAVTPPPSFNYERPFRPGIFR